jgi:hypothetical protein
MIYKDCINITDKKGHYWLIIPVVFLAILVRIGLLNWELPYYSIDENDVVEPALAFLCGDWDPHWYKYGPLFSYLLAFIYKVWMWIANVASGWTESDFFYAAFFEPTSFYVVARAFHELIIIGIAGVSWLFARRYFNSHTAVIALILGLGPFLDINTNFTIRIDTLMGLFSLSSLFFAAQFGKDRIEFRPYILSGIFAGLSIATKPLPGLLVLPALLFGHFLSVWQASNLSPGKKFESALIGRNIWILACAALIAHSLANPYSILNFDGFLLEQYRLIYSEKASAQFSYYHSTYDFSWLVHKWGWPMVIAVIAALLTSLRRADNSTRILLVYITVFIIGFLPFKSRDYWYNAMLPAVILIVALQIPGFSRLIVKYMIELKRSIYKEKNLFMYAQSLEFLTMVLLAIILTYYPYWNTGLRVYANWVSPVPPLQRRADFAAQLWIEKNLPAHSAILLVGRHAVSLPRIVADTPRVQAVWGEYFSYNRDENLPWGEAFKNAYLLFQQKNRPAYHLLNIKERSVLPSDTKTNLLYRENIAGIAHDKGCKYVIVASEHNLKGKWEEHPGIKLIAVFNHLTGHNGDEIKIFEVL